MIYVKYAVYILIAAIPFFLQLFLIPVPGVSSRKYVLRKILKFEVAGKYQDRSNEVIDFQEYADNFISRIDKGNVLRWLFLRTLKNDRIEKLRITMEKLRKQGYIEINESPAIFEGYITVTGSGVSFLHDTSAIVRSLISAFVGAAAVAVVNFLAA